MKKIIYTVLTSLMLLPGCAGYLDQDPGGMNTIDKVFVSSVSTKEWWARMFSDDFMVQEMHYSGQIPYFWCTDESCYVMESNIKNTSEGLMSPDNYYGYTGYNLYFFVRYYQTRKIGFICIVYHVRSVLSVSNNIACTTKRSCFAYFRNFSGF